jgi:hypothetical protein
MEYISLSWSDIPELVVFIRISCCTSGTRRATIVTNLIMNDERTGECLRHVKLINGHLWHRYSVTINQVMVIAVDHTSFEVITSTWPIGTIGLVVSSDVRLRTKPYEKWDDCNFPIVNFSLICNNIPAVPAYGVYISQLVRHSRTCGFYQD